MTSHCCVIVALCLLFLRVARPRSWTDCLGSNWRENDGMPRADRDINVDYEIVVHGSSTPLFEEIDPFRFTEQPSSAPSYVPSEVPTAIPSNYPSKQPSNQPSLSYPPTKQPTSRPTKFPTSAPTFSGAVTPVDPEPGYFNYDENSEYGPKNWDKVEVSQDNPDFWHTFDLEEPIITNDCGSGKRQSPIDLCTSPKGICKETHEMRPKSGDYKMDSDFITKQILPNKLRLLMAARTGEEPDPPQVDFSSNGRGIIDMTNIDFKFPSEHTVCGNRFDGEMQYFTYHPGRKQFVAVSFFLQASPAYPRNNHLQEVIDAFMLVFKEDKESCNEKQSQSLAQSFVNPINSNRRRRLIRAGNHTSIDSNTTSILRSKTTLTVGQTQFSENTPKKDDLTMIEKAQETQKQRRHLALKWHPFHPDIQKTVHFWGYKGSITEPPCTTNSVSWKIMDVPTPISQKQLEQFRHILLNHVDRNCHPTSVHNSDGSVARPIQESTDYYKCTRDDYVSDEERTVCGDQGCDVPFGAGLEPYYPPLVHVTGPPTRSPSKN